MIHETKKSTKVLLTALVLTISCKTTEDDPAANVSTSGSATTSDTRIDSSDTSTQGSTNDGSSETASMPQDNGAVCFADQECASKRCWLIPGEFRGGFCSECVNDDDCQFGCTPPNVLSASPQPDHALCNDGTLGSGCETSDSCNGALLCTAILDISFLYPIHTCSECETDADCDADTACAPTYDASVLAGHRSCVAIGSRPNGQGCDPNSGRASVCGSGLCASVASRGFEDVGVCSECNMDADCENGGRCALARWDTQASLLLPRVCGQPGD